MNAPNFLSIHEALRLVKARELAPADLVDACYRQIERLNPRLNAIITLIKPPASGNSHGAPLPADVERSLPGIPIAVKDLFETADVRTTAGSLFFKDYVPARDAAAVERLKNAGAAIIGKTNTHEIALGVTTLNPHFGHCHNPWDEQRIPGGSSGGSAVAVATGMVLGALGTDTGGSIRIPASLCGVVGLKPTFGRVSLRGVFPLSWNLDHAGPLTRTVKDAALILQALAGYDPDDPSSIDVPVDDYSAHLDDGIRSWRVGLGIGSYIEDSDAEVLAAVQQAAEVLEGTGAEVSRVDVSYLREAAVANGLMTQADGAAYHQERLAEHPDWFGDDVRRRLEMGRDLASSEYILARRTQAVSKRRLDAFFADHEILVLPSTPITAPPAVGEDAVEQARRLTRFTAPFNLGGVPAISIPCGMNRDGLPIGLQLVADAWHEAALLRAARAYEREANWSERRPPGV